jgi:hypothetical protein
MDTPVNPSRSASVPPSSNSSTFGVPAGTSTNRRFRVVSTIARGRLRSTVIVGGLTWMASGFATTPKQPVGVVDSQQYLVSIANQVIDGVIRVGRTRANGSSKWSEWTPVLAKEIKTTCTASCKECILHQTPPCDNTARCGYGDGISVGCSDAPFIYQVRIERNGSYQDVAFEIEPSCDLPRRVVKCTGPSRAQE